ncbi:hypothetical protein [Haloplasma contractile]|uniref:Reductase protein n=1 Tax=Haloplasma contractile SSD-17B TaxID=1033810 RepID=U2DQY3_9MOLU|nr:hypothetical protein [Haloplasma contractile]ERJ10997.1 Putative reductase protein [Haloplasma contractile SSD-17B]
MFKEVAEYVRAPRTILTKFPFGAPFGNPDNKALQMAVLKECLTSLENEHKPGEIRILEYKWREKL